MSNPDKTTVSRILQNIKSLQVNENFESKLTELEVIYQTRKTVFDQD